jgi:heme/copper-type cytochrome/quinol oxidase subunit 2
MLADDEVIELINSGNAKVPAYRLLSVDNYLYLPTNLPLRALVSSSDVLHS